MIHVFFTSSALHLPLSTYLEVKINVHTTIAPSAEPLNAAHDGVYRCVTEEITRADLAACVAIEPMR